MKNSKFDLFKKECKKWQKEFGLFNWDISFAFCELDRSIGAQTQADWEAKTSLLTLNSANIEKVTLKEIKQYALHEILETMLTGLYHLAESRNHSNQNMNAEMHNIIRIFEKVLLK
jgi:hypothetical protein